MYEISDKAIAILNKKINRRFNKLKNRISEPLKFDELNILDSVKMCYEALDEDNQSVLMDVANEVYRKTTHGFMPVSPLPESARRSREKRTTRDGMLKVAFLTGILTAYDPVTRYVYRHEVERKSSRLAEALVALQGVATEDGRLEYEKAKRNWALMTAQYVETTEDEAYLAALLDNGYTHVKWITAKDERVCADCAEKDGKIFLIADIPNKPHWRCRCYWVPVSADEQK